MKQDHLQPMLDEEKPLVLQSALSVSHGMAAGHKLPVALSNKLWPPRN
jgi:hypothetical protein